MYEMLREFARWLRRKIGYDAKTVKAVLYKKWNGKGAVDVEGFLYDMALFAVEKVFGESIKRDSRFMITIIPYESLGSSSVYVLEMKTKTVMASLEEITWHFGPGVFEWDLRELVKQLEEAKSILAVRLVADS